MPYVSHRFAKVNAASTYSSSMFCVHLAACPCNSTCKLHWCEGKGVGTGITGSMHSTARCACCVYMQVSLHSMPTAKGHVHKAQELSRLACAFECSSPSWCHEAGGACLGSLQSCWPQNLCCTYRLDSIQYALLLCEASTRLT